MCNHQRKLMNGVLFLALILGLGATALSQRLATAPVFQSVVVDGRAVLPEGAKVEGHVTGISPAERGRRPGTIAVAFDRILMPNGTSIPIDATLTTLSEEGRRRIEQDT